MTQLKAGRPELKDTVRFANIDKINNTVCLLFLILQPYYNIMYSNTN